MLERIDIQLNDIRPDTCLVEGLDCRTCTHHTASHIALLCPSLDGAALRRTFFEIYRHSSCAPMQQAFEWAYASYVEERTPVAVATAA